jgi:adenylate cyclase
MDLKDSTSIAEKLGHIKYSQLLQDCYFDLTELVIKYHAQIYQYVGDEVVLTWETEEGFLDNNCIKVFFAFDKLIKNKSEYYSRNYKLIPEFKAGLNNGDVTVAEIGEIKKELAYHGDVLNTAARIQEKCNDFQKRLLISESMKLQLKKQIEFNCELMGNVKLKGKENAINLYDVKPSL